MLYPIRTIYPYKREPTIVTCYRMGEPQEHNAKWKKAGTKDYMLLDSIYISRNGKSTETENRLVVA